MTKKKEIARKMKVKSRKGDMGFDSDWKIWQGGRTGKQSEKVVHLKGYDKAKRARNSRKPIKSEDIPW